MTRRLRAHPFEFAPRAARYRPLSWVFLLVGVAVLLAGGYLVRDAARNLETARTQQNLSLRQQKAQADQARRLAGDPLANEKLQAQRKLEALLQMPWSLLLDALEAATDTVEGRVTLVSMSPSSSQGGGPATKKVELSMVAKNYGAMLGYVDAMRDVAGFSDIRIINHQIDTKVGPEALRFQASAGWSQLKEGVFLARDTSAPLQGPSAPKGAANAALKGEGPAASNQAPAKIASGTRQ